MIGYKTHPHYAYYCGIRWAKRARQKAEGFVLPSWMTFQSKERAKQMLTTGDAENRRTGK